MGDIEKTGIIASQRKDRKGFSLQENPDVWYSGFDKLADNFPKGTEVEFKYYEKGQYKNVVKGSFKVTKMAERANNFNKGATTGGNGSKGADYEIGVTVGAALNQAVMLAAHGVIQADPESIGNFAKDLADKAFELKKVFSEPKQDEKQESKPVIQERPVEVEKSSEEFDSNIPF